jgi:hypothetical protein
VEKVNLRGKNYDEVYQMNFQFFPTTQRVAGDDKHQDAPTAQEGEDDESESEY